jgi:hypothetical protein
MLISAPALQDKVPIGSAWLTGQERAPLCAMTPKVFHQDFVMTYDLRQFGVPFRCDSPSLASGRGGWTATGVGLINKLKHVLKLIPF